MTGWMQPRSTDRDKAFRERVIRATSGLVLFFGILSFGSTILVFNSRWAVISFPTLHIVAILGCVMAFYAVSRGYLLPSGWMLVLTLILGLGGVVLLSRQEQSPAGIVTGIAAFMFIPIVAALVLPRNMIIPAALISVVVYGLSQFGIRVDSAEIIDLDAQQLISAALPLLLIEGTLLRQFRVEFDSRLLDMQESMRQTEEAKQQTEIAWQQAEADRQRAEEADQAKSQFLANMSHELRTPLNAIIGYSEAMLGGMAGEFTTQQTTLLGHVQHNSRRLLGLINDVLDLSKIEAGSMELHITPVAPQHLINETVDGLRSLAQDRGIYLNIEFDAMIPEFIQTDPDKIQQILVNLISNAVKFTDEGGVSIIAHAAGDLSWKLVVQDSGIGIPPDALEFIFDPFQQVDGSSTRKYRGTGLGLAIVKRLVEQMGGSITLDSELKKGSTFTIVLPYEAVRSREEVR